MYVPLKFVCFLARRVLIFLKIWKMSVSGDFVSIIWKTYKKNVTSGWYRTFSYHTAILFSLVNSFIIFKNYDRQISNSDRFEKPLNSEIINANSLRLQQNFSLGKNQFPTTYWFILSARLKTRLNNVHWYLYDGIPILFHRCWSSSSHFVLNVQEFPFS